MLLSSLLVISQLATALAVDFNKLNFQKLKTTVRSNANKPYKEQVASIFSKLPVAKTKSMRGGRSKVSLAASGYISMEVYADGETCEENSMSGYYWIVYGVCVQNEGGGSSILTVTESGETIEASFAYYYSNPTCEGEGDSTVTLSFTIGDCLGDTKLIGLENSFSPMDQAINFIYYNSVPNCDGGDYSDVIYATAQLLNHCVTTDQNSFTFDDCSSITYWDTPECNGPSSSTYESDEMWSATCEESDDYYDDYYYDDYYYLFDDYYYDDYYYDDYYYYYLYDDFYSDDSANDIEILTEFCNDQGTTDDDNAAVAAVRASLVVVITMLSFVLASLV